MASRHTRTTRTDEQCVTIGERDSKWWGSQRRGDLAGRGSSSASWPWGCGSPHQGGRSTSLLQGLRATCTKDSALPASPGHILSCRERRACPEHHQFLLHHPVALGSPGGSAGVQLHKETHEATVRPGKAAGHATPFAAGVRVQAWIALGRGRKQTGTKHGSLLSFLSLPEIFHKTELALGGAGVLILRQPRCRSCPAAVPVPEGAPAGQWP